MTDRTEIKTQRRLSDCEHSAKVKADAIREAINHGLKKADDISDDGHRFGAKAILFELAVYANKIEGGEDD